MGESGNNIAERLTTQEETLLRQFSQTFYALIPSFERYMGLSRARWQVLHQLARDGEISQALLQQRLRVDGAAITRQAKQLEDEGLVTRRADPEDNRFTLIALTAEGRELVTSLMARRDMFEQLATEGMSAADIEALRRCLTLMRTNFRAIERAVSTTSAEPARRPSARRDQRAESA